MFTPADLVDPPLSEIGLRQAEVVDKALANEPVGVVVCSHLSRAHGTAWAIASQHGLEPVVVPDLREVETYRDLEAGVSPAGALSEPFWRGLQERWPSGRRWDHVPFGESSAELRHRRVSTVEGLATHPDAHVVAVCHGDVNNAYLAHLLDVAQDMFFLPAYASVTRARRLGARRAAQPQQPGTPGGRGPAAADLLNRAFR